MKENYESLAAIAVFREMYDKEKDVYDILSIFLKDVIINESLNSFTLPELTDLVSFRRSAKRGQHQSL